MNGDKLTAFCALAAAHKAQKAQKVLDVTEEGTTNSIANKISVQFSASMFCLH